MSDLIINSSPCLNLPTWVSFLYSFSTRIFRLISPNRIACRITWSVCSLSGILPLNFFFVHFESCLLPVALVYFSDVCPPPYSFLFVPPGCVDGCLERSILLQTHLNRSFIESTIGLNNQHQKKKKKKNLSTFVFRLRVANPLQPRHPQLIPFWIHSFALAQIKFLQ